MTFPAFTVTDLSAFSGRAEATYTNTTYVTEVLAQSMILFRLATEIPTWPTDDLPASLAEKGVLSLADQLYLGQQFQGAEASPFQSETIGSYSYSKANSKIVAGLPTGITWFDLAVRTLAVEPSIDSNSISIMEDDDTIAVDADGKYHYIGPLESEVVAYRRHA